MCVPVHTLAPRRRSQSRSLVTPVRPSQTPTPRVALQVTATVPFRTLPSVPAPPWASFQCARRLPVHVNRPRGAAFPEASCAGNTHTNFVVLPPRPPCACCLAGEVACKNASGAGTMRSGRFSRGLYSALAQETHRPMCTRANSSHPCRAFPARGAPGRPPMRVVLGGGTCVQNQLSRGYHAAVAGHGPTRPWRRAPIPRSSTEPFRLPHRRPPLELLFPLTLLWSWPPCQYLLSTGASPSPSCAPCCPSPPPTLATCTYPSLLNRTVLAPTPTSSLCCRILGAVSPLTLLWSWRPCQYLVPPRAHPVPVAPAALAPSTVGVAIPCAHPH